MKQIIKDLQKAQETADKLLALIHESFKTKEYLNMIVMDNLYTIIDNQIRWLEDNVDVYKIADSAQFDEYCEGEESLTETYEDDNFLIVRVDYQQGIDDEYFIFNKTKQITL